MAEWSNAAVLKTVVPRGTGGSNPSLSAEKELTMWVPFFYASLRIERAGCSMIFQSPLLVIENIYSKMGVLSL